MLITEGETKLRMIPASSSIVTPNNEGYEEKEIKMERASIFGKLHGPKCFLWVPVLMTFFVLTAFYRNQQFLDENPADFFAGKFTDPDELKFPDVTSDQFVILAVIVKGDQPSSTLLRFSKKSFLKLGKTMFVNNDFYFIKHKFLSIIKILKSLLKDYNFQL